ncbi:hypothetical protein [Neobacillus sp. D3-1R]|uniref:hypothetical protein n=1 Tax=Neobacillus sp. D3-1R TaxID=3445778 RepID=UPI003F9F742B
MYIVASFQHSKEIEMALADLSLMGLSKSNVLVLPLDKRLGISKTFDSSELTDRETLFDIAAILGMIFMLLGSIYGFVLKWGPIIWGLIGLVTGISIGFLIKFLYIKRKQSNRSQKLPNAPDIIVIIHCEEYQVDRAKDVLWENNALGLTTYNNTPTSSTK